MVVLKPIQIAGIIIGAVLGSIVLTTVVCCILIRRRRQQRQDSYIDENDRSTSPQVLPSQSRLSSAFRTGNSIVVKVPSPPPSPVARKRSKLRRHRDSSAARKQRKPSVAEKSDDLRASISDHLASKDDAPYQFDVKEQSSVSNDLPQLSPGYRTSWPPQYDDNKQAGVKTVVAVTPPSERKPPSPAVDHNSDWERSAWLPKEEPSEGTFTKLRERSRRSTPSWTMQNATFQEPVEALVENTTAEPVKLSTTHTLTEQPRATASEEPRVDPFDDGQALEVIRESIQDIYWVPLVDDFDEDHESTQVPLEENFEDPFMDHVTKPTKQAINPQEIQPEDVIVPESINEDFEEPLEALSEESDEEHDEPVENTHGGHAHMPSTDSVQRFDFEIVAGESEDELEDAVASETSNQADQIQLDDAINIATIAEAVDDEPLYDTRDKLQDQETEGWTFTLDQPDHVFADQEELEDSTVHAAQPSASEAAMVEDGEPLRYSIASEIDTLIRAVSQQSAAVYDEGESWRDSFARTGVSPPRSPSPVEEEEQDQQQEDEEASKEREDALARAILEARERTISPLRRNPVTPGDLEKIEPAPPVPALPVSNARLEVSPLRQNPPFQAIASLLEESSEEDEPEELTEEEEEEEEEDDEEQQQQQQEEVDDRATRGRSMIRTSDIIEARLSAIAQIKRDRERITEEVPSPKDVKRDLTPATPVTIHVTSAPPTDEMDRTLSPLRRNPVDADTVASVGAARQFRPQKSSPLPTSSLLRPIPTAAAVLSSRDESPMRPSPLGQYHASALRADGDGGEDAKAGGAAGAPPKRASNALFTQALSRFRDLDARNPQEAAMASNEVTSRAIAGIYIPGSLREQAVRNLSKSRERGMSRTRATGSGKKPWT